MSEANVEKEVALEGIINSAIQIPGVKVNRTAFLAEIFANENVELQDIIELGPIGVNIPRERLSHIASKLIFKRTSQSSIASFVAGIPGGLAMAATIPLDVLQFFGMALKMAQELSYIYGAEDIWNNGQVDDEKVKNQLLLYCGVMFGVSGAVSGVRVLSTQIAKTTLKKLPQKALTKTFWYPIVKQIGKAIGIKVTKTTVAQGVSKAIPIIGGIISGSLNFASMMPMATRLQTTLDKAVFDYSDEEMENDIIVIENISDDSQDSTNGELVVEEKVGVRAKLTEGSKKAKEGIAGFFSKKKENSGNSESSDILETIKKLSELKDAGIITQEEFDAKKSELMSQI